MNEKAYRISLMLIGLAAGLFGIVLMVYPSFKDNEADGEEGRIAGEQEIRLVENGPLTLKNFNVITNSSNTFSWSENTKKQYLDSTEDNETYLSYLNDGEYVVSIFKDNDLDRKYEIATTVDLISIFDDGSIAFIDYNAFTKVNVLVLMKGDKIESFTLPIPTEVTSFLFDPQQSIFYFTTISESDEYVIYAQLNNLEMVELYKSKDFTSGYFLEYIDTKDQKIFVRNGNNCSVIDISNKDSNKITCKNVFEEKSNEYIIYNTEFYIYYDKKNKIEKTLFTNETKLVRQNFNLHDNKIFFVQFNRDSIEDKYLNILDLKAETNQIIKTLKLPSVRISDMFVSGENIYIVLEDSVYYKSIKNVLENKSDNSNPLSFPVSSAGDDVMEGWTKVEAIKESSQINLMNTKVPVIFSEAQKSTDN